MVNAGRACYMGMGVRMPKYLTIYYRSTGSFHENMRICQGNLGEFSGKNCPTSIAINQLAVKITRRSLSFGCICINSSTCIYLLLFIGGSFVVIWWRSFFCLTSSETSLSKWITRILHYDDVIMGAMASQITSLTIVYSTVYSGADQSKQQSSASPAFVWAIHRVPVNSPHKWPVTRKMFPFDDVIMLNLESSTTKQSATQPCVYFMGYTVGWYTYSISQEICTRFCCALLCCGYAIVHNEFTWSIYPYSSGLLCWHWGNR